MDVRFSLMMGCLQALSPRAIYYIEANLTGRDGATSTSKNVRCLMFSTFTVMFALAQPAQNFTVMEGYLSIVVKGFATTRLRKVWVVLDRQQLTWYDHLDLTDQLPKKLKGVMFIRDAVLRKVADTNTAHALSIECNAVKTVFYCTDATVCSNWYKALTRSISIHNLIAQNEALPKQYTLQLGLSLEEELTKANIAKAYKRLCLKEHPDKGGNPEEFNKVKEAYNYLMARQTTIDEMESTVPLQYEATIVKQAGKVGFGMSVNDDRANERLLVGKVQDDIIIVDISEESGGKIRPGDRIIGIDHDDCSHWMMSRLVPRLGLTRIPVGGTAVFTFERRVSPDELDEEDYDDEDYDMTPQPSPMVGTIYQKNSNSPMPRSSGTVTPSNASETADDAKSKHTASEAASVRFATAPSAPPAASAASSSKAPTASEQSQQPTQPSLGPAPDAGSASSASSGDGSPVPQPAASTDSSVLGSPSSMQARAAARERLRLRALEASSAAAEPIIVVPSAPSDSSQPSTDTAPSLPPPVVVMAAPVVLAFPPLATAPMSLSLQPPSGPPATSGAVLMAPYSGEASSNARGGSPSSSPPPPPPLSPVRAATGTVLGTGEYALSPERPARMGDDSYNGVHDGSSEERFPGRCEQLPLPVYLMLLLCSTSISSDYLLNFCLRFR
jgi:hypothetical protein